MDWREWFNNRGIPLLSTELGCDLTPEEIYQAFVARWNEEEYPKLLKRVCEDLGVDTSGLKGKLEERDGK